jgi:hypothetical protein
MDLRERI